MYRIIALILPLLCAPLANATTYQVGGDCGALENHVPDADVNAQIATGVNINSTSIPLDNIEIPLEIPLSDYTDISGINANLSETRIRPGSINVNTNTGTVSVNGQNITAQPIPNPDCGKKTKSIYSTK